MGKASKWFRGLLGLKKPNSQQPPPEAKPPKKKWSFVKSYREKDQQQPRTPAVGIDREPEPSMHAIAVAAATAAVAEAAVAAAQAAAEVVRLTSSGRAISGNVTSGRATSFGSAKASAASPASVNMNIGGRGFREDWAAVVIQSHFRAYLARRALRALRALVRLQAIVRGRIERRRHAVRIRELRSHAFASIGRAGMFESPHKACYHVQYSGPATPEKIEHLARAKSMKQGESGTYRRNGSKNRPGSNQNCRIVFNSRENEGSNSRNFSRYDEMHDKILEVDNGRPPPTMGKRRNIFHSSHLSVGMDHQYGQSFTTEDSTANQTSSFEVQSTSPFQLSYYVEDDPFFTAESSPQIHRPFTPTRSDGSRSCMSGCSDYPNYMTCTESSKAKMRSLSAPRQRPNQYDRSGSTKRFSIHGYGETRVNHHPQRVSALYASKAYPGSGRLDRLGMPVREEAVAFSGGLWQ